MFIFISRGGVSGMVCCVPIHGTILICLMSRIANLMLLVLLFLMNLILDKVLDTGVWCGISCQLLERRRGPEGEMVSGKS